MRFLVLIFLNLAMLVSAHAESNLSERDFAGGYIVARATDGSTYAVEMRLKVANGGKGLVIKSFKAGTLEEPPTQNCKGNGFIRNSQLSYYVECGKDEYSGRTNLPDGDVNLKAGVPILIQGHELVVKKQKSPYFR